MKHSLLIAVALGLSIACQDGHQSGDSAEGKTDDETVGDIEPAREEVVVTEDVEGVVVAKLSPDAEVTQVIKASENSVVKDVSVAFPPDSLAVATDISIEEGAPLVSFETEDKLSLDEGVDLASAGPTVVIASSKVVDAALPFVLALPIAGIALVAEHYAVVFNVLNASTGKRELGIASGDEITIKGSILEYKTTFFGAFQVVTTNEVVASTQVETTAPVVRKLDPYADFFGSWVADDCGQFGGGESYRTHFTFAAGRALAYNLNYTSSDCSGEPYVRSHYVSNLTFGDLVEGTSDQYKVDEEFVELHIEPLTQAGADRLNEDGGTCGLSDLQVGVKRRVPDANIASTENSCPSNDVGTKRYTSYKIAAGKLHSPTAGEVNSGEPGSSDALRATELAITYSRMN